MKDRKPQLYLYAARMNAADHPIKIGITRNVAQRINQLRKVSPYPLDLLATRPSSYREESTVHKLLEDYRIAGEWYRPDPAILWFVFSLQHDHTSLANLPDDPAYLAGMITDAIRNEEPPPLLLPVE